jgi:hypothetical protein
MLTLDGVHMKPPGDMVMATGILRAFGLSDDQISKAREHWLDQPAVITVKAEYPLMAQERLTLRQYEALRSAAGKAHKDPAQYLNDLYAQEVNDALKKAGIADPAAFREQLKHDLEQKIQDAK